MSDSRNRPDPSPPPATPSDTYTHGHHPSVLKSHTWRTVENSAAYLIPYLRPGLSLLDVGCGPGTITTELAARISPGPVTGIDAALGVIDKARTAAAAYDNLTFEVDDCYGMSFADDSFDVVHAHQVLQHLSDPVSALGEMKRVVKPDGIVAVRDADYDGMFWYPRLPGLDRWMNLYQAVARRNRAEPDAGRRLCAWARSAGFGTIIPSASTWCFATPEERHWWGELWSQRVEESALATQAVDYGLANRSELADLGRDWIEWSNHPDAWFVVVNGEAILRP